MSARLCRVHQIPLVCFCPACRGAEGGKVRSSKQLAAALKGARRQRKYKKRCTKYRSHVFSPKTGKCYGCSYRRPRP